MEKARETFPGEGKEKDHLKDFFGEDSFLFLNIPFSKELIQFELLQKGGKHW